MIIRTISNIAHDCRTDRLVLFLWLATAAVLLPWVVSVLDWFFWLVHEDFRNRLGIGHMRYVAAAGTVAQWVQRFGLIGLIGFYIWTRERGTSRHRGHCALTAATVLIGTAIAELTMNLTYIALNLRSASLLPPGTLQTALLAPVLLCAFALLRGATGWTIVAGKRMAIPLTILLAAVATVSYAGGMTFVAYGTAKPVWKLVVLAMAYYAVLAFLLTRVSRSDVRGITKGEKSDAEDS